MSNIQEVSANPSSELLNLSLIQPSNACPVIHTLPVELLQHIFRECEPGGEQRLKLTQICQYWRTTAMGNPLLWTDISIGSDPEGSVESNEKANAFLSMQFGLSRDLPLSITWTYGRSPSLSDPTLALIREKAPFNRWRDLTIGMIKTGQWEEAILPSDMFTNLETLTTLRSCYFNDVITKALARTTTSKLKTLTLGRDAFEALEFYCRPILERVSTLLIPNGVNGGPLPP